MQVEEKSFIDRSPFLYKVYHESFLSKPLHKLKQIGVLVKYKYKAIRQFIQAIPRDLGKKDSRFLPLLGYKNKYRGKRIFITCTGPSLTIEDLEKLKDEYVFGMNSICLIHDKTDWTPDFFGIQDDAVYEKVKNTLLKTDNGVVFAPYSYKKKYGTPDEWVYWHLCGSYHMYELIYGPHYFTRFNANCYAKVYDGYSITYSILQLAMYMGFDEIYLLGADCNYLGKNQHFIEHGNYEKKERNEDAGLRLTTSYKRAQQYAEKHGVKIFNATRGGCLELFQRVKLEDVLEKNEKNKSC